MTRSSSPCSRALRAGRRGWSKRGRRSSCAAWPRRGATRSKFPILVLGVDGTLVACGLLFSSNTPNLDLPTIQAGQEDRGGRGSQGAGYRQATAAEHGGPGHHLHRLGGRRLPQPRHAVHAQEVRNGQGGRLETRYVHTWMWVRSAERVHLYGIFERSSINHSL